MNPLRELDGLGTDLAIRARRSYELLGIVAGTFLIGLLFVVALVLLTA